MHLSNLEFRKPGDEFLVRSFHIYFFPQPSTQLQLPFFLFLPSLAAKNPRLISLKPLTDRNVCEGQTFESMKPNRRVWCVSQVIGNLLGDDRSFPIFDEATKYRANHWIELVQ